MLLADHLILLKLPAYMKGNDGEAQVKKLPEGKVPEEVHKEPKDVPSHGNEQVTEEERSLAGSKVTASCGS